MSKEEIKVKGCGCRYRGSECDHLCDRHKDEFILKLYNKDKEAEQYLEGSCSDCLYNHKRGFKIEGCYCSCHIRYKIQQLERKEKANKK